MAYCTLDRLFRFRYLHLNLKPKSFYLCGGVALAILCVALANAAKGACRADISACRTWPMSQITGVWIHGQDVMRLSQDWLSRN